MTKYGIKRACIAIAVLFAVNIAVITLAQRADAASYKRGSTGSVVSEIQQKLKDWGYYSAEVDGVYGSRTEEAVLLFQQKNGLAADGKAGAETARGARHLVCGAHRAEHLRRRGAARAAHLRRGARRELRGAGRRGRGRDEPHRASVVPEHALRRHLSARGVLLSRRRAVRRAGRAERLCRRARRHERLRSDRWRDLLLQSRHGDE